MNKKMTCRQVQTILPFYIQGKVNAKISAMIEEHLEECSVCKKLYIRALEEYNHFPSEEIRTPATNIKSENFDKTLFMTKSYADFKKNLSAYFDSELNDEEQFRIKKITISNPLARMDLETMYRIKQILHKSFEKTKNSFKKDFSKSVIKKISQEDTCSSDKMFKYSAVIFIIAAALTIGLYLTV